MKLIPIIFCMLVSVTMVQADIDTVLIREAGISNLEELHEFLPNIAKSILAEREIYPLIVLYENWDNGGWIYDMKDIHSYDENGYPLEILMQDWEDGSWLNFMKMCMSCDDQGLIQESLIKIWDPIENLWSDMMLMSYSYDGNGNWIEILNQIWIGDDYMLSSRLTREYNNQNNPTFESNEVWNFGGSWVNNDQSTFSYEGGFLTEILKENWEDDSYWGNAKLTSYEQDSGIYPSERLLQTWDGGGYWVNTRHSDYTYDNNWHEIEDYEQIWEEGMWMDFQTHYYSYDDEYLLERLTKEWDTERSWLNHSRYSVEYGNLNINDYEIPKLADFNLTNYPNPFNPSTEIRFQVSDTRVQESDIRIEIFNLRGHIIKTLPVTLSDSSMLNSIEGSDFGCSVIWNGKDKLGHQAPSGIYFYKLKIGRYEQIKKMIMMK